MEMVNVLNYPRRDVKKVPKRSLPFGMIQIKMEGKEGTYWVDESKLKKSKRDFYSPYKVITKERIQYIRGVFNDFRSLSNQQWTKNCD